MLSLLLFGLLYSYPYIPLLIFLGAGAPGCLAQLSRQERVLSVSGMIYALPVWVLPFFFRVNNPSRFFRLASQDKLIVCTPVFYV